MQTNYNPNSKDSV